MIELGCEDDDAGDNDVGCNASDILSLPLVHVPLVRVSRHCWYWKAVQG